MTARDPGADGAASASGADATIHPAGARVSLPRTSAAFTPDVSAPRRIAVEGPIGVGKTSLARRLAATFALDLVLEPSFDNPYLERFYRQGQGFALQTQLYFLLKRRELLRHLAVPETFRAGWVCDFVLEKDALFAALTLADDDLALYRQLQALVAADFEPPDLVIYLQASPAVLAERVKQRGLAPEQRITPDYLQRLCAAYTQLFHFYDQSRVLIVNAGSADLVHDGPQYEQLVQRILNTQGPREYYNPQPDTP